MARRVVVVDNHDSFTFLLVDYLTVLGAECLVVVSDAVRASDVAAARPDGVLLSPGPGRPEQAGVTLEVIDALAGHVPILGVCLGHQAIALQLGAAVVHAPRPAHGKAADIFHDGLGVYRGLPNPLRAGRYHSLVVDRGTLPAALGAVATCRDGGDEIVMGIRGIDAPLEGIQFHPESVLSEHGLALLDNWLESL